jgi:hypothetical protein
MAMGFKVRSELPGYKGRLDLLLELPNKIYAIIELKYCQTGKKPTKDEEDDLLANWAISDLAPELKARALAEAVREKLPFEDIDRILSDAAVDLMDNSRQDAALASRARAYLTADERKTALAAAAREKLTAVEIKEILLKATSRTDLPTEQIEDLLSEAARKALSDITKRRYRGIARPKSSLTWGWPSTEATAGSRLFSVRAGSAAAMEIAPGARRRSFSSRSV